MNVCEEVCLSLCVGCREECDETGVEGCVHPNDEALPKTHPNLTQGSPSPFHRPPTKAHTPFPPHTHSPSPFPKSRQQPLHTGHLRLPPRVQAPGQARGHRARQVHRSLGQPAGTFYLISPPVSLDHLLKMPPKHTHALSLPNTPNLFFQHSISPRHTPTRTNQKHDNFVLVHLTQTYINRSPTRF